jgi:Uma2 family endonuclease
MGTTTTLEEIVGVLGDGYPREVTKSNVNRVLSGWSLQRPAFRVFCETVFQVDEQNCLVPDVSVVQSTRIVPGSTGIFQGAPELAVEIVFSELATSLEHKIELYCSRGSKSVWVIYPELRVVQIFDASGCGKRFERDQPLTDPAVLPGFSIPTSAIFEGV